MWRVSNQAIKQALCCEAKLHRALYHVNNENIILNIAESLEDFSSCTTTIVILRSSRNKTAKNLKVLSARKFLSFDADILEISWRFLEIRELSHVALSTTGPYQFSVQFGINMKCHPRY